MSAHMNDAVEQGAGRMSSAARRWVVVGAAWFLLAASYTVWAGIDLLGRQEETIVRTFSTSQHNVASAAQQGGALDTLDVRTDGDIEVIGADTDVVTVERKGTRSVKPFRVEERVMGTTLSLAGECPKMSSVCSVQFTVIVPRSMSVKARSNGNSIRVVGVSGAVMAESTGGQLRLDDALGDVTANSGGGEVRLRRLSGNTELNVASGGGGVDVSFASAPSAVRIDSAGGDIRVEIPRTETSYRVEASSNGGSSRITVRTDAESARIINVNSGGGALQVLAR